MSTAGSYEKKDEPCVVGPTEKRGDVIEEEAEGVSRIYSCTNGRDLYSLELAILGAEYLTDC